MNPLIVTIIIALAAFIVSIFGASWLNQQAMNWRIDGLREYLDARFGALDARFETIERTMNARFKGIEETMNARFDSVDARFDSVDKRISNLEQRVERIERQLDSIFRPSLPRA